MQSVSNWLEAFGFSSNPFEVTEAEEGIGNDSAAEFLESTFVEPAQFEDILGNPLHPKSTLVFAPRGSGKSSLRVMLANKCRSGIYLNKRVYILPIILTHFLHLNQYVNDPGRLVDEYAREILNHGVAALIQMIKNVPDLASAALSLKIPSRIDLLSYLWISEGYISIEERNLAIYLFGTEITSTNPGPSLGFLPQEDSGKKRVLVISNNEIDEIASQKKILPGVELLARFVQLVVELGIPTTYVLIDGLDEDWETASNPDRIRLMIGPLLSNLALMNSIPHLAFKVFAPTESSEILLSTSQIRKDRLMIIPIQWDDHGLLSILRNRLSYCSQQAVQSLTSVSSSEITDSDSELVKRAYGNPRHLILLGQFAIENRCQTLSDDSQFEDYLLRIEDFDEAAMRLDKMFGRNLSEHFGKTDADQPIEPIDTKTQLDTEWPRNKLPSPLARSYLLYIRAHPYSVQAQRLFELIEGSLAYLGIVMVSALVNQIGLAAANRLQRTRLRFEQMTLGGWYTVLKTLPGLYSASSVQTPYHRQMQKIISEQSTFLETVIKNRNSYAHDGPKQEPELEEIVRSLEPQILKFLDRLSFITADPLLEVTGIERRAANYLHHCWDYRGDATIPLRCDVKMPMALENARLLIVHGSDAIDLHPLLISRPSSDGAGREIWLYQAINDDSKTVAYKNYGLGQVANLSEYYSSVKSIFVPQQ